MNIRKAFLLTLIVAICTFGLTLTGCEKKSDEPAVPEVDTEAVEKTVDDAAATAEDAKEDAEKAAAELME